MAAIIPPVRSEDEVLSSVGARVEEGIREVEREQSMPMQSLTESGIIPEPFVSDSLPPENSTKNSLCNNRKLSFSNQKP